MTTWLASTSQEARTTPGSRRSTPPGRRRAGSGRVGALGAGRPGAVAGWSLRYWRVSSTWNRASRPSRATVDGQVEAGGRRQPYRHVLPPRLVGRGPAGREGGRLGDDLGGEPGVVVLDLVVVPGDDPRAGGVDALQRRVALVQTRSGCGSRPGSRSRPVVGPDDARPGARSPLVDVVAQVQDQVGVVRGGVRPQRTMARRQFWLEQEPQPVVIAPRAGAVRVRPTGLAGRGPGTGKYQRPGAADRRRRGPSGPTPAGDGVPPPDHVPEAVVGRHLPAHRHVDGGHAAAAVGGGASRVHSTTAVGSGSPGHTQGEQPVRQGGREHGGPRPGSRASWPTRPAAPSRPPPAHPSGTSASWSPCLPLGGRIPWQVDLTPFRPRHRLRCAASRTGAGWRGVSLSTWRR